MVSYTLLNKDTSKWITDLSQQDDGVWATQLANVAPLSEAFLTAPTVVLFFSVNGSHGIQGYVSIFFLPQSILSLPLSPPINPLHLLTHTHRPS